VTVVDRWSLWCVARLAGLVTSSVSVLGACLVCGCVLHFDAGGAPEMRPVLAGVAVTTAVRQMPGTGMAGPVSLASRASSPSCAATGSVGRALGADGGPHAVKPGLGLVDELAADGRGVIAALVVEHGGVLARWPAGSWWSG
jgi:hypothetical protein